MVIMDQLVEEMVVHSAEKSEEVIVDYLEVGRASLRHCV